MVPARRRRARSPTARAGSPTIDDAAEDARRAAAPPAPAAAAYAIEPVTPIERYLDAVEAARDAVRAGRLVKAVIAREIAVDAEPPDRPPRRAAPAEGVVRLELPLRHRRLHRRLAGAARRGRRAHRARRTRSPAPRRATGDPDRDAAIAARLVDSTKNQVEHRVVIDVVHDTLLPWCSYLDWEPEPVDRHGRQRAAPRHPASRAGCRRRRRTCSTLVRALSPTPGARRPPRRRGAGADRRGRGRRSRPLRRRRRLGRRRRQRHVGRGDPLRRAVRRPAPSPGSTPAAASSPTATRSPSWPRRRPSSRRCSRPSSGPDRDPRETWARTVETDRLSATVGALADPTRRAILARLPGRRVGHRAVRAARDVAAGDLEAPQGARARRARVTAVDAQRRAVPAAGTPLAEATHGSPSAARYWEGSFERSTTCSPSRARSRPNVAERNPSSSPRPATARSSSSATSTTATTTAVRGVHGSHDLLRRGSAPHGLALTECAIDLSVGGHWRYVVRQRCERRMITAGLYRDVEPPATLVTTQRVRRRVHRRQTRRCATARFDGTRRARRCTITVRYATGD